MSEKRFLVGCLIASGAFLFLPEPVSAAPARPKPVKVVMNQITAEGIGAAAGSVTLRQTKDGVELAVDLAGLTPGDHGFHLHEMGSCAPAEKDGKPVPGQAAGPHWDPDATKAHKGPGGGGHKGDLPKLIVPDGGKVKAKFPVSGLTLADLAGRSLMIHAGGDTYSDTPKPLGGGGDRVICGVIPGGPAAPTTAKAVEAPPAAPPQPAAPKSPTPPPTK